MYDTDLTGRRILVVEDEYFIAIDIAAGLESLGAEIVGMAGTVEEALSLIETQGGRIDGAVLDVNLGGERVYPVADALMSRAISFVFAASYDGWVVSDAYAKVWRCEKPVQFDALARHLMAIRPSESRPKGNA